MSDPDPGTVPGLTPDRSESISLLVVDDEPDQLELTAIRLERESDRLNVETAASAAEGLECLSAGAFDCIVSDYMMPEMDGLEFLEAVREDHPDVPFILLTGRGDEAIASEAITAGVTDYIPKGDDQQYTRLASRVTSVVEQKRTNEALERTHEWFRTLIERSTDVISVVDDEGIVRYVSPSAEYVLDENPEEMVGHHVSDYVHPDDHERTRGAFLSVLEDPGSIETVEYRYRGGDDRRWVESIFRNELDTVGGVVVNSRVVTERKERERELRRQNERLDRFASIVSHDLRNPLEVANAGLELLQAETDSDHVGEVERALERIDAIIDDVLSLARHGGDVEDPEPVDLERIARRSWETVETGGATLRVWSDTTLDADPSRLGRVFENLFRNSVEHGSTGSRTESDDSVEHGSTGSQSETGDSVEHGSTGSRTESDDSVEHGGDDVTVAVGDMEDGFYVEDDGEGIPEDERHRVFDPDYSTAESGTGIGLFAVEDIATAHGWSVRATEGSAGGARFEFTGVDFRDR